MNLFTVRFFLDFRFVSNIYCIFFVIIGKNPCNLPHVSASSGCCCHKSGGQGDDRCVGGELSWQTPGQVNQHGEEGRHSDSFWLIPRILLWWFGSFQSTVNIFELLYVCIYIYVNIHKYTHIYIFIIHLNTYIFWSFLQLYSTMMR